MSLAYAQSKLIQGTLPALREHGEQISSIFYATMLNEHPELKNYFNSANQANGRQPRALTSIIIAFAANISHTSELVPKLERVCHKHCSLGIQPDQYAIVGEYLIRAFSQVLGDAMTDDVRAAWTDAYCVLARMMMGREAQLYKSFGAWQTWRRMRVSKKVAESEDVYSFYLEPTDDSRSQNECVPVDAPAPRYTNFATRLRTSNVGRSSSSLGFHSDTEKSDKSDKARLPHYRPGQYVSVRMFIPSTSTYQSRQYSLSTRYHADHYRISVKRDEGTRFANTVSASYLNSGLVSNAMIDCINAGDCVDVSHPTGEFFAEFGSSSPLVLISAGIGASPMMAILETVAATQPGRRVTYIHGSRYSPPVFAGALQELQKEMPTLRTAFFYSGFAKPPSSSSNSSASSSSYTHRSREVLHAMANAHQPGSRRSLYLPLGAHPGGDFGSAPASSSSSREFQGHVDLQKLLLEKEDLHLDNTSTEYFVCGPESFMLDVAMHLVDELHISRQRIRFELFSTGDLEDRRDSRVASFLGSS
ncbi:globin-like protein [Ophiostoma piceae UAMH 11346]|uniref:nitric oxide dioxygenase n=1 Tax=Ophiostoma piceae (strain UAMH 11346) TaxID=1262450 RepID=S3CB17_OPHP1|nr:globin-like protein [Ophiostoma piceae UAMH 11346]